MNRLIRPRRCLIAMLFVAGLLNVPLFGGMRNPFHTPPGWSGLLGDVAVQKAIGLSEEQVKAAMAAVKDHAAKPDEAEAALRDLLTEKQFARLKQFDWQREGGYALFDAEVSKALAIDHRQQSQLAKVAKANETSHKEMRDFMARARFRSKAAAEAYVKKYRDKADENLLAVLREKQRVQLKTLLGEPLEK